MEIVWKRCILSVAVIYFCAHVACSCDGLNPKYGNMTKDQQLEVGSTLSIKCTLFMHNITTNDTTYYVTSGNLMVKFKNIYLENLEILDDFSVLYTKENATINDTGLYNCFLSIPTLSYNPFICATEVAVGYKPLPVKNFSCIGLYYQRLNCSWVKPFNPVKTKYELFDIFLGSVKRRCAYPNDTYCVWAVASSPPYRKSTKELKFKLVGTNSLGQYTESISVNHFEIVKPNPPRRLMFTNATKTSIDVRWLLPIGMEYNDFPPGLDYSLHYCPLSGLYPELCGTVNTTNKTSCVLTNLVPFIQYKVSLRCRSTVAKSELMWSSFLNSSFRTEPDVPHLAPETTSSSFEMRNIGYVRDIILYWKPIPSKFEYGQNFSYIVNYHTHYRHPRYKRAETQLNVGNVTTHTFRLDTDTAYLFKIYAVNHVGISSNYSVIIVDKAANMIKGPTDIAVLSYGHGKYSVSWKSQALMNASDHFTLFWCRDIRPRPFKCAGPIEWLNTNKESHELVLPDNATNYQFAISVTVDGLTSGMAWASCIVPYGGVLYSIGDLRLTPKNATSIRVHWVLDCSAQKSVIEQYRITFCRVAPNRSCLGEKEHILLNNSNIEQYIVGSLNPYTKYKFNVQARTTDGWSEDSNYRYETTFSAAPADSPRHVKTMVSNDTVIKVKFQSPQIPNGKITQYVVLYGIADGMNEKHKMVSQVTKSEETYERVINKDGIFFYTNYSIEVKACVELLCSPASEPNYVLTGIGPPGRVDPPHTQLVNTSMVNVTWKPPSMPNGPIDMYIVTMAWQVEEEGNDEIRREVFNVSENFVTVSVTCLEHLDEGLVYYFSIQALNVKNGSVLIGNASEPSQTRLCFIGPTGISPAVLAGLITGIACGLIVFVISIYALAKWMKKKVDMVKSITVQLPSGLDSPVENPLNSYDKFKNGLQKNRDSGIPSEHTYERLCSYASDKSCKDFENFYEASSEEYLNTKTGREKSGRNQSGDSNTSGKCHDSISSSNTNKTHLSIDSGAEMDLPQSPDGIFSDTSSSNTTPRSYKPDLEIVEESNVTSSKDSGLEKEGLGRTSPALKNMTDITNGFPYYIRKKNQSYFNVQMLKKSGQIQPYSKFAIIAPAFTPKYVTYGVHNLNLLNQQSLANSEPSVAEAQDEEDDSEPLMMSRVPPYCRFGLARSAGTGINIVNQATPVQPNLGYSKFGIIYGTLGQQKNNCMKPSDPHCAPNYTRITCPKIIQNPFAQKLCLNSPTAKQALPNNLIGKLNETKSPFKSNIPTPEKKPVNKGYVSFSHALATPSQNGNGSNNATKLMLDLTSPTIGTIPEVQDEKLSIEAENIGDDEDVIISDENRVLLQNQPQPHINGYVSFQDAKVMSMHDPVVEDNQHSIVDGLDPISPIADTPVHDLVDPCVASEPSVIAIEDNRNDIVTPSVGSETLNCDSAVDVCDVTCPDTLCEEDSSNIDEPAPELINDQLPCNGTIDDRVQIQNHDGRPHDCFSSCQKLSESENSQMPQRTMNGDVPKESCKPKSNGYVPWAELLDTDKPSNFAEVITFPNNTMEDMDITNI